jgi:hypothetical protein
MPIDHSIYLQQRAPDIAGSIEQGLRLGDLIVRQRESNRLRQEDDQIRALQKQSMQTGENGEVTLDEKTYLSGLAKINPQKAMEAKKALRTEKAEEQRSRLEASRNKLVMMDQLLSSARDQRSYEQAINEGMRLGFVQPGEVPKQYDPNFVNSRRNMVLSAKERADQMWKEREFDLREKEIDAKREDVRTRRAELRQEKSNKRDDKLQELQTPYGIANTADDAKKLKEAFEAKKNFDNKIQQMIDLRVKHGGGATLDRTDVARGKQLSKDLLLEYKNMAKLGVLSQSDEAIINAIIPEDPLQYNDPISAVRGQDPTLTRLQSFKADSDKDFETRVATRTRAGVKTAAQPAQPQPPPQGSTQVWEGVTYLLQGNEWVPQGNSTAKRGR